MKKYGYFGLTSGLLILAILCALQAFNLSTITIVDGDGIGLTFLGIVIDDSVATEQIPVYKRYFAMISVFLFLTTGVISYKLGKVFKNDL